MDQEADAVARINAAVRALDMKRVREHLSEIAAREDDSDPNSRVYLCECSEDDWKGFLLASETTTEHLELEFDPQNLAWEDNKLYVVEYSSSVQSKFSRRLEEVMASATGTNFHDLQSRGATFVDLPGLPKLKPSFSFGPAQEVQALGAELPSGLQDWEQYHTIKGEVGVHRTWKELDRCAQAWQDFPGVKYVLCIRLSPSPSSKKKCEYKFHTVNRKSPDVAVVAQLPPVDPMPIDGPATYVTFDPHHSLGLSPVAKLPEGFSSQITIDLYEIVQALEQGEQQTQP